MPPGNNHPPDLASETNQRGRPPREQGYKRRLVSARLSRQGWENAQLCAERSGLTLAQVVDAMLAAAPEHPAFAPCFDPAGMPGADARAMQMAARYQEILREQARALRQLAQGLAEESDYPASRWDGAVLGSQAIAPVGLDIPADVAAFYSSHVRDVIASRLPTWKDLPAADGGRLRAWLIPEFDDQGELDAVVGVAIARPRA